MTTLESTQIENDDSYGQIGTATDAENIPRAQLVRKIADIVVLPTGRISSNERSLAGDILLQVLDKVDESLRMEIANRVSRVPDVPAPLIRMLLLDEPEIAAPIIRSLSSLPEALLIECARLGTTSHRMMIAQRIDLTPSVADALLDFDEPMVAMQLLKRDEFNLSPRAIDLLVARSVAKKDLQSLLLRRPEIEPAHGFMMFWWVDGERRKRILTRFAMDRTIIQDSVQDLYPVVFRGKGGDPFVKEILTMLDRRHRPRGTNGEPISMDIVAKTLAAARSSASQEVVMAIGMIAGVSRELAARILRDPGGEPFAVMCKSLGLPRADFFRIVGLPNGDAPADPRRADQLLEIFDSMARDFSRAVLRYWDWDGNPRIAYITRLLGLDDDDYE